MIDYSKWKKIDISDDEDDTHPNIDTGSLFRWRHEDRVKRLNERQTKQKKLRDEEKELAQKLKSIKVDTEDYKQTSAELDKVKQEIQAFERRERLLPWNVDTISQDDWSKTVINTSCLADVNKSEHKSCPVHEQWDDDGEDDKSRESVELDQTKMKAYNEFVETHESSIREFGFRSRFDDCRRYLLGHPDLVSQHTYDYLCIWCLQLELENKRALFEHVSRQAVVIQMLLDLAKSLDNIDPRSCLPSFFNKAQRALDKFQALVDDELKDFGARVKKAGQLRMERALKDQEDKPEALVGPGGLNAQEVLESLPQQLQDAFIERDDRMLQEAFDALEPGEAERHLKRCIDSGLWVAKPARLDPDELLLQKVMQEQEQIEQAQKALGDSDEDTEDA